MKILVHLSSPTHFQWITSFSIYPYLIPETFRSRLHVVCLRAAAQDLDTQPVAGMGIMGFLGCLLKYCTRVFSDEPGCVMAMCCIIAHVTHQNGPLNIVESEVGKQKIG